MKKFAFLILFVAIGFQLKAQQNKIGLNNTTPSISYLHQFSDTIPSSNLSKKQQNDLNLLFSPQVKTTKITSTNHNLTALLDNMPIVTPQGNWKMPIARPDRTTKYNMLVLRGQPIVKPGTDTAKITP
jgi:hypothetical protein